MSLFGQIASLDDIVKRLPQFQIQLEKLEEEEGRLERGSNRGSFNRRCQDLAKQVNEQRQKLDQAKGGSESTRAAAIVTLDDLQRRLYSMAPEKASTSRSSATSADLPSQQEEAQSDSSHAPKLGATRRPSMYENYSSDSEEEREKRTTLPAVREADESGSGSPPTPAPRKTEPKPAARKPAKEQQKSPAVQMKSPSIEDESPIPRPPRSSSPGVVDGNRFLVLADLDAVEDGDLSIRKGQVLRIVLTRADGWWKALNEYGEEGLVPKTYLQHIVPEEIREEGTRAAELRAAPAQIDKEEEHRNQLLAERRELDERRREVEEARRQLEVEKRSHQRELLRQMEEEKERLKEEHLQTLLDQRKSQIEESTIPRHSLRQPLAVPSKLPVTCLGDALRADPHLTFQCHLTPRLSHSNLAFHDLFWNYQDDKLRKRRVTVSRVIRLVRLESMPNVEFGLVRAALYDQSRKTGRQIVSNVHTIRAQVKNGTWSFITRTDTVSSGVELGDFVVRSNYRMVDVVLLMEASVVEKFESGFREKSVGVVKVPIMGNNGESCLVNKTYSDYLTDENIFQKGSDVKKTNSRIYFKVTAVPNDLIPFVDSMPDVLLFNPMFVRLMHFYRRRAGTTLIRDRDNPTSAEMVSDPLLAVFPAIADQPDLMDLLRTMWTSKVRSFKAKPETEQAMDFFQVFMNTVFCIHKTAIMPDYCIWDQEGLQERQKVFKKCVEMLREYKTASRFLLTITSQPTNIYDYSFDLLGPHALD